MRFRSNFGALGWGLVGLSCFAAVLWFSGLHSGTVTILAAGFVLMSLQRVVNHFFIYWDCDEDRLRERRFWQRKEIAWNDVTRIGQWARNSNYLIVDRTQLESMSDRSAIVACPEDRAGFLKALHRFAPKAQFDV